MQLSRVVVHTISILHFTDLAIIVITFSFIDGCNSKLGQNNTYDITDMLDDFDMTFMRPLSTSGFPFLNINIKKVERYPHIGVALVKSSTCNSKTDKI